MIPRLITILAASSILAATANAGDPEAGQKVFRKCQACHMVGEGAANRVGPELNGLFGRPAGSVEDYAYSDANQNSGIVWSVDVFSEYIRDPRAYLPGTKMAFAGLKKSEEIDDLVAYLQQFGPDGAIVAPAE